MSEFTKILSEKDKLMNVDDLMKEVKRMQQLAYEQSIDFYAEQQAKNRGKDLTKRFADDAIKSTIFEKSLFDAISSNKGYNEEIKGYLRKFETIEIANTRLHKVLNKLNISQVINLAKKERGVVTAKLATGIVGAIEENLTGNAMRKVFTKEVQKVLFDNLILGTPFSTARANLSEFIRGKEGLGQLERWSGQITRDALNQYDGKINAMVAEEYGMNAYRYTGSLITDSREQCERWVNRKILLIKDLTKEIEWANSQGSGMIPGTNKKNFAQFRGGYNCRHSATPTFIDTSNN